MRLSRAAAALLASGEVWERVQYSPERQRHKAFVLSDSRTRRQLITELLGEVRADIRNASVGKKKNVGARSFSSASPLLRGRTQPPQDADARALVLVSACHGALSS